MNLKDKNIFIIDGVRTPIGSFQGVLNNFSAIHLGREVIHSLIKRNNLPAEKVDEVFWGNVCSANLGQSPARQVSLLAGLNKTTPATIINKVCASSLKAISLAAGTISWGDNRAVIAGGMESMSNIPHYLPHLRGGSRFGDSSVIDGMIKDGLSDAYENVAMGILADRASEKHQISREEQDAWAKLSYQRALNSQKVGIFNEEIIPLTYKNKKGEEITIREDEEIQRGNFAKAPLLKPAFSPDGTVTAFNASKINDGAAGVVIAEEKIIKEFSLPKKAKIIATTDYAKEPEWFTTAPLEATEKILKIANLTINDIDFIEVNEAFSVVPLIFQKAFGIPSEKINIHGGAVALGHPIGASGSRIVVTLLNVLRQKKARLGLAVICNGDGGASAMIIENVLD